MECQQFLGIKSQSTKWHNARLTMKTKLSIISYTLPQGKDINWQNYLLKANIFISLRGHFRRLFKMGDSSMNILNLPESALNSLRKSDFYIFRLQKILDLKGLKTFQKVWIKLWQRIRNSKVIWWLLEMLTINWKKRYICQERAESKIKEWLSNLSTGSTRKPFERQIFMLVSLFPYYRYIWGKCKDLRRKGQVNHTFCLGRIVCTKLSKNGNRIKLYHRL